MNTPIVNIDGVDYELDTTLRVAYKVQDKNNHRAYSKVFEELGDMTLEKQIEILYVAFQIANPEMAKTFTQIQFFNYYLDHYTLKDVMAQLKAVIQGVLGETEETEQVAEGN